MSLAAILSLRSLLLAFASACALGSCALASGDAADAGEGDARVRSDASPGSADAEPMVDGSSSTTADASPPTADATQGSDAQQSSDTVLITEIVDGTLTGGLPKFVEISNLGASPVDLAGYSLGVYSNGGTTLLGGSSVVLSGDLAVGSSFVVSFETGDTLTSSSFLSVYGFNADNVDFGAQINGNDVVALFRADGNGTAGAATASGNDATLVDIYGVIGVNGAGQSWEYTDGFATRRQAATLPSSVFDTNEWGFSGVDALDGLDAAGIIGATSPGSH